MSRSDSARAARQPTILYTLGALDIGGTEMRSLQLFTELRRRHPSLPIHLYVQSQRRGPLDAKFVDLGVSVIRGYTGWPALRHFWQVCRQVRPDIVHTCIGTTNGFMLFAAFLCGIPDRICHFSTTVDGRTSLVGRLKAQVGLLLARAFSTHLVGVADACRAQIWRPDGKWRTIYRGLAAEAPQAAAAGRAGRRRILVLARIHPQKNHLRPVPIFEALRRRAPDLPVILEYVGPGQEEHVDALRRRIAASPEAEWIELSGPTRTPLDTLRGADLLLLPSQWEGLPGVVLEALSVGTPVVASDLPGVREIAQRADGIRLVPTHAPDECWVDAIVAALAGPAREHVRASFAAAPAFHMETYVAGFEDLWGLPRTTHAASSQAAATRLRLPG
ncbi:glycosyltransferase family 4 protein [Sphingomonas parva]|nr:glycosyltransferase family 4 protein [Sphingomonas parva]